MSITLLRTRVFSRIFSISSITSDNSESIKKVSQFRRTFECTKREEFNSRKLSVQTDSRKKRDRFENKFRENQLPFRCDLEYCICNAHLFFSQEKANETNERESRGRRKPACTIVLVLTSFARSRHANGSRVPVASKVGLTRAINDGYTTAILSNCKPTNQACSELLFAVCDRYHERTRPR